MRLPVRMAVLAVKIVGMLAQYVRDELVKMPNSGDPVVVVLMGVYGRDWKGVLRKEYQVTRSYDLFIWHFDVFLGFISGFIFRINFPVQM